MTNSRKKGSRNERDLSKLMQLWTGYEFARTPQSGGLHWKKQHTCGDIVCIDDIHGTRFSFSIEAKFYLDLDLLHLIDNTIGRNANKITGFWEQCKKDAIDHNKTPMLFMRRNGMKANMHFVIMEYEFYKKVVESHEKLISSYGGFHFTNPLYDLMIINSEDLLKMDYQILHKIARKNLVLKNKEKKQSHE